MEGKRADNKKTQSKQAGYPRPLNYLGVPLDEPGGSKAVAPGAVP